jgi:hypothetical protein
MQDLDYVFYNTIKITLKSNKNGAIIMIYEAYREQ